MILWITCNNCKANNQVVGSPLQIIFCSICGKPITKKKFFSKEEKKIIEFDKNNINLKEK